ncbi:MAG: Agmatinase [Cenarchaeum symbiont of Oopsacas minuta]|nr:Agmatinase [Cenarchaeum symbiont of Oopsacas minuta]
MSFTELYKGAGPLISGSTNMNPAAIVFGIPFDSTHSYKPGTRFGPDAIRDAFNNIEVFHPELGVDLEDVPIHDLGNIKHTVDVKSMLNMVSKMTSELAQKKIPIIILGGEHSLTYGSYTAFPKGTGYVVFDAHYDLRDGYIGSEFSHASYLRKIIDERGSDDVLHVGARAYAKDELVYLKELKLNTVTDKDVRMGLGPKMISDFVSKYDTVYASFDLDVLDPAFAPGVGNPEAVGIFVRELFDMIASLRETQIVGSDIVELNPTYDNGSTAIIAAKILSTIIATDVARTK